MARGSLYDEIDIGDVVTTLGRIDPESDREFGMAWVDGDMDNAIGITGEITRRESYTDEQGVSRFMYKVKGCTDWWWIAEWLDISEPDNPEFAEDFDLVFN